MSLPAVLRAARSYADAEAARLASFGLLPEVIPDYTPFPDITFADGLAHYRIDSRNQPRTFDPAFAFVITLFVGFGGTVLFNSRTRRNAPHARYYVCGDIGEMRVYLNRIIMDAQPGEVVRERGTNFRSHLPEDLVVREAPLADGPNKHVTGRWDAVEAILAAYDRADVEVSATTSRHDLESLLTGLLVLADARASERATQRSLRALSQQPSTQPTAG